MKHLVNQFETTDTHPEVEFTLDNTWDEITWNTENYTKDENDTISKELSNNYYKIYEEILIELEEERTDAVISYLSY